MRNHVRRLRHAVAATLILLPLWPTAEAFAQASQARIHQPEDPLLQSFRWRSIGPANMGGRIDEIAVVERDTRIIYKGFATGGLFKSVNNGITWEPIFDVYGTSSIGSVAVSQSNPNIVWVAAAGALFAASPHRGIYKTSDGGRTWRKVAFVDDDTGFTDVVVNLSNPDILFAASYQRRRTAFGFSGGGPGSAIWQSQDGGENWTRLQGNGLPGGTMGRIALDIHRANPNIVFAQIEVADDSPGAADLTKQPR